MSRVIVVEDEPITAADLEHKLIAMGHEVTWFDTGEEAVASVGTVMPDLVLMDIRLRDGMDGIEAARQLRALQDVPIVFITAFSDQATVDRACETEPYGYLAKPFTERSVATAVHVALTRAAAERTRESLRPLDEISRSLAHEINNPLTFNLGAIELAQQEIERIPALLRDPLLALISEYLRDAREGAVRVADVVRELNVFSLWERDRTNLEPRELIERTIQSSQQGGADHVRWLRRLDAAPTVHGNEHQLVGVLSYAVRAALERRRGKNITLLASVGTDRRGWAELRICAEQAHDATAESEAEPLPRLSTSVSRKLAEGVVESHGGELLVSELCASCTIELHLPPATRTRNDGG